MQLQNIIGEIEDSEIDSVDYSDILEESLLEKANEKVMSWIEIEQIAFSLSYSQWDWVSIVKADFDPDIIYNFIYNKENYNKIKDLISFEPDIEIVMNSLANRYTHENTFEVNVELNIIEYDEEKIEELIDNESIEKFIWIDWIQEDLTEHLRDICKELEKIWYEDIEELEKQGLARIAWIKLLEHFEYSDIDDTTIEDYILIDKVDKNAIKIWEYKDIDIYLSWNFFERYNIQEDTKEITIYNIKTK